MLSNQASSQGSGFALLNLCMKNKPVNLCMKSKPDKYQAHLLSRGPFYLWEVVYNFLVTFKD